MDARVLVVSVVTALGALTVAKVSYDAGLSDAEPEVVVAECPSPCGNNYMGVPVPPICPADVSRF